jgi:uncharacterized protein (TIGR02466 family)
MNKFQPFTPIEFFQGEVKNNDDAKKEYHEILSDLKLDGQIKQRGTHDPSSDFDSHNSMPMWTDFLIKYLSPSFDEFLSLVKKQSLSFTNIWTQETTDGRWHPPHTHSGNHFSMAYYVDVDEKEHCGTTFIDPNISNKSIYDPTENSCFYNSIPKEGTFIIFPSWIMHYQEASLSPKPRFIISANMDVTNE